jgi:hypothetical protein
MFGPLTPDRRMQMAQALSGGNDQWAPIRQAMMARGMGAGAPSGQMTPPSQVVSPGEGGLLSMLGRLFNKNQPQAPAAAPASPYTRDMASLRARQMAQALNG